VQLEDQVLRQLGLITPDDPANTSVDETEFVAGCVDRLDSGKLKVPLVTADLGVREGRYEATAGCVDVDGDVDAGLLLVGVEYVVNLPDWLVVASVG